MLTFSLAQRDPHMHLVIWNEILTSVHYFLVINKLRSVLINSDTDLNKLTNALIRDLHSDSLSSLPFFGFEDLLYLISG